MSHQYSFHQDNLPSWASILLEDGDARNAVWKKWEKDPHPMGFFDFIYQDLGEPTLGENQRRVAEIIVGSGGLKGSSVEFYTKGTRPLEAVLLWGKGSGKGFLASNLQLFNIYMLHFLPEEPLKYFHLSRSDDLAILIVATNKSQAQKTFDRILRRLLTSKFFSQFPIEYSGKIINKDTSDLSFPKIFVSQSLASGGGVIRFSSLHLDVRVVPSRNESFEGSTIIGFVMDEASGFSNKEGRSNADKIYGTLTSSTRELPYLGLITSFPRQSAEDDFTFRLFASIAGSVERGGYHFPKREGWSDDGLKYASYLKPWEAKPKELYSGNTFRFVLDEVGIDEEIPVEYQDKFLKYPYDSISRYLCIPVGYHVDARFAPLLSRMSEDVFILPIQPLTQVSPRIVPSPNGAYYLFQYDLNTVHFNLPVQTSSAKRSGYFLGLDAGEIECEAVIVVAHAEIMEDTNLPFLVIDSIIRYTPDPRNNIRVDLMNYFSLVSLLANRLSITHIRSDKWNTAAFKNLVPHWDDKPVGLKDYSYFRSLLYEERVKFTNSDDSLFALKQFRNLINSRRSGSKPILPSGCQDLADSIVSAASIFRDFYSSIETTEKGEVIFPLSPSNKRSLPVGVVGTDPHEERLVSSGPFIRPSPSLGIGSVPTASPSNPFGTVGFPLGRKRFEE